jgi:RNA polymerase sigma-70 factor (ECF subfamily)
VERGRQLPNYKDITVHGITTCDAAWFYPRPSPLARRVKGRVAFWHGVVVEPSHPPRRQRAPLVRVTDPTRTPSTSATARFDALVVPEIPAMWRAACAICGNTHDAEDLVQESLIRAYRFLDGFDGAHPRAWLLTIVRNTHRNSGRRQRPSLLVAGENPEPPATDPNTPASAEDTAMAHGFDDRVEKAVRSLSPKLAQVVALIDIGGFTYDEAGAALGIPPGTVMSRLHRGRRHIRTKLDRYPDLGGTRS